MSDVTRMQIGQLFNHVAKLERALEEIAFIAERDRSAEIKTIAQLALEVEEIGE